MKKIQALALAALLALTAVLAAACGIGPQESPPSAASAQPSVSAEEENAVKEDPAESQGAQKWMDSDIAGSVTAEVDADLKDDFHLEVNKDWLSGSQIKEGALQATSFTERNDEVTGQILELLKGDPQPDEDAQMAQLLYNQLVDMETRNAQGMDPVLPYIKEIQAIETLDDLTAYMKKDDQIAGALFDTSVMADRKDSGKNAVYLGAFAFSLNDADEYKSMTSVGERRKEALEGACQKLLMRVGYSQEEAERIVEEMFRIETEIARSSLGSSDAKQADYGEKIYHPVTVDELAALSPDFPIVDLLSDYTEAGVDRFILTDQGWLAKMNEVYTQENVEAMKDLMLCSALRAAMPYLDQECLDIQDEATSAIAGLQIKTDIESAAYTACDSMFDMVLGKMYVDHYVSEDTKKDIEDMISDVVAVYKKRLEGAGWLGEETRQKAIEKLNALRVRVAYPDDWTPYGYDGPALAATEDGGTLLGNAILMTAYQDRQKPETATEEVDLDTWLANPQTVNAYYHPSDNSINIPAGILGGIFYDPQGTDEENMGGIGMIIGHEITHGFDTTGSQYDKDGNLANWWTDEDRAAFEERTDKVDQYFSGIEVLPGKYVDGQLTIGETVADLGGVSCMLEIARGQENFDYTTFFTSFAQLWKAQNAAELEELLLQDPHPPGYLRTNVNVQQFQEFYDAFGIGEGDGMYLAPEDRLSVW